MRLLSKPWSPEEDEQLKAMVAVGASVVRAAAALKRRHGVVRQRARGLGCPFQPVRITRKKWANTPNNEWQ